MFRKRLTRRKSKRQFNKGLKYNTRNVRGSTRGGNRL